MNKTITRNKLLPPRFIFLFSIIFFIFFSLTSISAAQFGYNNLGNRYILNYGDDIIGDYSFNGGWETGGLSIIDGDIYAQTGYFYNITSLNVTKQNLTIISDLILNGFSPGSILFTGLNSQITEDNSNFFWDDSNNRLGIGTNSPNEKLEVDGSIRIPSGEFINFAGQDIYGFELARDKIVIGLQTSFMSDVQHQLAFGALAGSFSSGDWQTAIGGNSGQGNTGLNQLAIGTSDGFLIGPTGASNTGDYQIAIGGASGSSNTGEFQIAIGSAGMFETGTGQSNTGDHLIAIGNQAGAGNSGDDSIFFGYEAGEGNSLNYQFILKQNNVNSIPLIQGNFSSGYLGINMTTPQNVFNVQGDGNFTANLYQGGLIMCDNGTATIMTRNSTLAVELGCVI
jgi:hypothetical protein